MENVTCYTETPHLTTLFFFVSVFGGIVAVLSIAFNLILLQAFLARPFYRQHSFVYFIALAVADILLSLLYILLFSNSFLWEYLQIAWLFKFWHYSLRYVFPVSHMVQFVIPYFLVVATIERYLKNVFHVSVSSRSRLITIGGVVLFSIASKVTTFWEIELELVNCSGFGSMFPNLGPLARNKQYEVIFMFWYRNITSVFVPFGVLLMMNLRLIAKDFCGPISRLPCVRGTHEYCETHICSKLASQSSYYRKQSPRKGALTNVSDILQYRTRTARWVRRARTRVRKISTRTLIAIAVECLLCHSATFVVTVWEHIDLASLRDRYKYTYMILVEVINFLNLFASTIRLPTYLYCDVTFRKEFLLRMRNLGAWIRNPFKTKFYTQQSNGHCRGGVKFENVVIEALAAKKQMGQPNIERLV